jgi:hypothetical protein
LKEAKRHSEPTVDAVAKALGPFRGIDTKYRDFKAFHFEQAIAFKRRLTEQKNQQTGEKLSKATLNSTLAQSKRFFHWLAGQPGYKSRLQYSDADYFNLSEKDVRVATAKREQVGPTGTGEARHRHDARPKPDRAPGPRPDRLHAVDRRAGQRHCLDEAEARQPRRGLCRPGCSRGPDEVQQDLHHLLLSGR